MESVEVDETKEKAKSHNTTDSDLVELAGYHAYRNDEIGIIEDEVNGKEFYVVDVEKDTESGFQAFTVRNMETNEISIVYVGSQDFVKDWVLANTMLTGVPSYMIKYDPRTDALKYAI